MSRAPVGPSPRESPDERPASAARVLAPLFGAGALAEIVALAAPHLPDLGLGADALAVLFGVAPAMLALSASSRARLSLRPALLALAVALSMLAVVFALGASRAIIGAQVVALLTVGRIVGGAVGERIAHPGHVLPACFVAAMADVMSVVSPSGASHAIAASPRALAVLALAGAVPGTPALTFMLGVGDLVIAALLTSAAARFALSPRRVLAGCFVGLAVAFVLAAVLGAPIPALVGLAIAGALAEPAFRRVPKKDRNAAVIAMVVSAGLAAFVLLRR